jgi:hypothetical protein
MKVHAIVDGLETAQRAVSAGATVVQLRVKAPTAVVVERGHGFTGLGVTFIVNDDVDAAIELDADGVHLGQTDEGAERARAHGLWVGRSVATVEQEVHALDERVLRDHEPADDGRVVLDADDQPAPLELGENRELTRLRERRQRPSSRPARSRRG